MKKCEIYYSVKPSFADGYSVFVLLNDWPMIEANLAILKYPKKPSESQGGGRVSIPYPRVYLTPEDVQQLRRLCEQAQIPLTSNYGVNERDGVIHQLQIKTIGYSVTLVWGTEIPGDIRHLLPLVQVLERQATKEGLDKPLHA